MRFSVALVAAALPLVSPFQGGQRRLNFAAQPLLHGRRTTVQRQFMPFPTEAIDVSAALDTAAAAAATLPPEVAALQASDLLLSFSDQGNNLAGIFFQGSLPPYLLFLYFLNYKGNKTPKLMGFGFGFLLLFVLATIPTGLISKGTFGESLADCDWLHGAAESLLTVSNVLVVLGLREALLAGGRSGVDAETGAGTGVAYDPAALRYGALAIAAAVAAFCGSGVGALGLEAHTPFLGGLGALEPGVLDGLEEAFADAVGLGVPGEFVHFAPEPENALSVPTWAVHFSSVFEFIFAMSLVWRYADATGNEKWKGVTWGMLPSHASGVAACTYHFFFNQASLASLVTLQAGLTALGNTTLAIACWRLALSNGWTLQELNPFASGGGEGAEGGAGKAGGADGGASSGGGTKKKKKVGGGGRLSAFIKEVDEESTAAVVEADAAAAARKVARKNQDLANEFALAFKLVGSTLFAAYLVKYGELALGFPQEANGIAAAFVFLIPPYLVAKAFLDDSKDLQAKLPSL